MAAQYRTINRRGHSIYEEIRKAGFEPLDYICALHKPNLGIGVLIGVASFVGLCQTVSTDCAHREPVEDEGIAGSGGP
ncbi:hypothetical protein DFH09DRAFT_1330333 [Mycena vulgaris]|nr:hypothetical protein DFH09DRAFT_1330333 [Mycena vulgaris]